MGGRGASSGVVAFDVNMDGHISRFVVRKGKTYKESGEVVNLSAGQVMKNAKSLGYDVNTYNAKQAKEREERRKRDREETNKFLNAQDVQMGDNKREQRRTTRARRGARRGI